MSLTWLPNAISALRLLTASHDVVAVVIHDPAELSLLSGSGEVRVRDPESRVLRRLAITRRTRRRFSAAMADRHRRLTDAFYQAHLNGARLA